MFNKPTLEQLINHINVMPNGNLLVLVLLYTSQITTIHQHTL
jgi:hypothetical protein